MNKKYLNLYIKFLKRFIKIKRPVKVVFDCSNGTTGIILLELFRKSKIKNQKSKIDAVFINDKVDGNFPGHGPNPMAEGAMKQLRREIKKQKADLGVIFDGDGDRVFFTDNRGRPIDANEIGYILMQLFKSPYVVGEVSSWRLKRLTTNDRQLTTFVSRVGHYFFKKLMREKKAALGLEHSGHYYFKDFFYCDAGIFAAINTINFVSDLKMPLSDWLDKLPKYYRSGEINFKISGHPMSRNHRNIRTSDVQKLKILKKVEQYYKKQATKISKLDGLTMEFPSLLKDKLLSKRKASQSFKSEGWWFNLRPSNTENLLRLNMETKDKNLLRNKLKEIRKIIEQ